MDNNFQDLLYGIFGIGLGDSAFIVEEANNFEVDLTGLEIDFQIPLSGADLTNTIIHEIYTQAINNAGIEYDRAEFSVNCLASSLYVDGNEVYSADDLKGLSAVDKAN